MSTAIKNVAVAGGSGNIGTPIVEKLIASGKFNVTVLRRNGSEATYASGATVVDVDFASAESIKKALTGQDAVVASLPAHLGDVQKALIDASLAAGVQRFIPSEFGGDIDHPVTRKIFAFQGKVAIQEYLFEKTKDSTLSYTLVYSGPFLDWGIANGFLFNQDSQPVIVDDGEKVFSTTTVATVGDAVVGVLSHPEETKNRAVRVNDINISQNQLYALAKKAAPEKKWEPKHINLKEALATANERIAQGIVDWGSIAPHLYASFIDPNGGGRFDKLDNELLGLKGKTEDEVVEIIKKNLK